MARYIDADKLLEELQEEIEFESSMYTEEQNKWFNIGLKCAVRDVKHQHTADVVEVKHGEWKHREEPLGWQDVDVAMCSECHEDWVLDEWDIKEFAEYHRYCPYCGAKMDGKKDSNDV